MILVGMNYAAKFSIFTWILVIIVFAVSSLGLYGIVMPSRRLSTGAHTIQIVAAENFWGSLIQQIGGSHVHVTNIISDPNADPHEFASSATTARAFANADMVVVNGAGYDGWATKLLSTTPKSDRMVLDVAKLLGKTTGDNPHFWYNPAYVNHVALRMEKDLIAIDPGDRVIINANYQHLQRSLRAYQQRISALKAQYAGTPVASTEDIFVYTARAAGLDLISPPAFMQAVAEGNDPPTESVIAFQKQIVTGKVKLLVYNRQTVTPLTSSMKAIAQKHHIPIVGITEIIEPPSASFQTWMNTEITDIQKALNSQGGSI